jgi:hypothetical protein
MPKGTVTGAKVAPLSVERNMTLRVGSLGESTNMPLAM